MYVLRSNASELDALKARVMRFNFKNLKTNLKDGHANIALLDLDCDITLKLTRAIKNRNIISENASVFY